ncbi:MAG TPA: T9SS type A sorting domain-containing protein [Ignavibacteriaceae bacterium]|nr:T9SS type A sorting domain-containing protein [Ignavibacteriaceae bacterium]
MIGNNQMKKTLTKYLILLIITITFKLTFSQSEFVMIVLPDTQYYSEDDGTGSIETFYAQTNWIVDNKSDMNVVYVGHVGDCVQNDIEAEWQRADTAMEFLEDPNTTGLTYGIPYGIAVGNHDMTPWDNDDGTSTTIFYNQYFGISRFSGRNYYGGHLGSNNDNHYDLFQVGLLKFVVIYIKYGEYRENPAALSWASGVLSSYGDRLGIVVSHKLLDGNSGSNVSFSSAGEAIFDELKSNPNLFLMVCGHWTDEGRRTDTNDAEKPVYTIMADYQGLTNGGNGWLRIMRFVPMENKIYVSTYSPTLNDYRTGDNSQFTLNYDFQSLLPVELSSFTAAADNDRIILHWRTETELNNHGFDIERSVDNINWNKIGFAEGHGNSNIPKDYLYTDNYPPFGKVYYRLKQVDNDGKFEYSNTINIDLYASDKVVLKQNYPNPFNPTTKIEYSLPKGSHVSLKVYDLLGREVVTLQNKFQSPGSYSVEFDGSNLASGIYFYVLVTDKFTVSKKMNMMQ